MRVIVDPLNLGLRAMRTLQAPQHVQYDVAVDRFVVSPKAFKKQSDGTISVDLEEVLLQDGYPIDYEYPRVQRPVGLVAHMVGRLVAAGFAVTHNPVDGNDYHGLASGDTSGAERRSLSETCEIVRPLDQAEAKRQRQIEIKLAEAARAAKARDGQA